MITLEDARLIIRYDALTGLFHWVGSRRKCRNGDVAGYTEGNGYVSICLLGRKYRAHRLAWLFHYGQWPQNEVDHIDRDKGNNRIANLRSASRSQNMANTAAYANNKAGLKGAYKTRWGWKSTLRHNGKSIHLGTFETAEEAHRAFVAASLVVRGDFARGA